MPDSPQPGDVIFLYGGDKLSFWSGFFQRGLFDHGRVVKPWFSHVAVVLNKEFAYEATPHSSVSSSGCALPEGVRLVPIADLVDDSHKILILRSPSGVIPSTDAFELRNAHIAGLYGATYSIYSLKRSAEEQISTLLKRVPDGPFKTKGTADAFVQIFREKPDALDRIKAYLPPELIEHIGQDYFCSQLVMDVLLHAGMLGPADKRSPITPCGLHDLLIEKQWVDVQESAYGNVKKDWSGRYCDIKYRSAVLQIAGYKSHLYVMGGLSAGIQESQDSLKETEKLDRHLKDFTKSLQDMTDSLLRISRDKPL